MCLEGHPLGSSHSRCFAWLPIPSFAPLPIHFFACPQIRTGTGIFSKGSHSSLNRSMQKTFCTSQMFMVPARRQEDLRSAFGLWGEHPEALPLCSAFSFLLPVFFSTLCAMNQSACTHPFTRTGSERAGLRVLRPRSHGRF